MDLFNYLSQNATGFTLAFNFVLFGAMLYLNTKFAPKSTEAAVQKLEVRVTRLEDKLDAMPSKEELHKLALNITELRGQIFRLEEKLDGAEELVKRVELQSNRLDDYMRKAK